MTTKVPSRGIGLGIAGVLLALGIACYPLRASVPLVLRGVLPDFLWAAAFACALMTLTRSWRWVAGGFVVAEVLELAQLHPRVPGTFDPWDLFAIGAGFMCVYIASISLTRRIPVRV